MPTTTDHGIVIPSTDLEPADIFGVATRLGESVEEVFCPSFTAVTFENSWVDYGSTYEEASYAIEGHRVWLRGSVKHATTSTVGTIFTLPSGYCPAKHRAYVVPADGGIAMIKVGSDGIVSVLDYLSSGTADGISLDGIAFDTAS